MRIVIAPDSFKGSASSPEAAEAIARGIAKVIPGTELIRMPMADGGEGTAEAMRAALNGEWIERIVCGPIPDSPVSAGFVWFPATQSALVEMASASGLVITPVELRNPINTTTYGTGELIAAAAAHGARRIWLAVGGSATVDGGTGAARALGWKFSDGQGREVPLGGRGLRAICHVTAPEDPLQAEVEVLCDVDNPLTGDHGAARVFGPQKGATPEMVVELEAGLEQLAAIVRNDLGIDIATLPGGGAAGGLSAGAVAFMNGAMVSGASTVAAAVGLREALTGADWVLTGEGSFDAQSLRGKVVSGVVAVASRLHVPIGVIAGRVALDPAEIQKAGVKVALPASPPGMDLQTAMSRAVGLIEQAAERFAAEHLRRLDE